MYFNIRHRSSFQIPKKPLSHERLAFASKKQILNESVIEEDNTIDFIDEGVISVGSRNFFILNEDMESYEVITEGILGDYFKQAFNGVRWMWGNIKDALRGKLPEKAIRNWAKIYREDPKKAMNLYRQYELNNNPNISKKELERRMNAARNSLERVLAARTNVINAYKNAQSNDPQTAKSGKQSLMNHASAFGQVLQAKRDAESRGEDPKKAMVLAAKNQGGLYQVIQSHQPQSQSPATKQSPATPQSPVAAQAQQNQQPITDAGFTEGDNVFSIDPKTKQQRNGKIIKASQQMQNFYSSGKGHPSTKLSVEVNGKEEALTAAWQKSKNSQGKNPPNKKQTNVAVGKPCDVTMNYMTGGQNQTTTSVMPMKQVLTILNKWSEGQPIKLKGVGDVMATGISAVSHDKQFNSAVGNLAQGQTQQPQQTQQTQPAQQPAAQQQPAQQPPAKAPAKAKRKPVTTPAPAVKP